MSRTSSAFALALALLLASAPVAAQAPAHVPDDAPARYHPLPTLREQAVEQQEWLRLRLTRVLPELMAEYDVDMWILSMR
ncbi:MAG: Xaa-Pro aminopeptidase, partial [Longimicrobiales bacterium]